MPDLLNNALLVKYAIKSIYDVDQKFLNYKQWSDMVHDIEVNVSYRENFQIGDDEFDFIEITKEEYLLNSENPHYSAEVNYSDIYKSPNIDSYIHDFNHDISMAVMNLEDEIKEFIDSEIIKSHSGELAKHKLKVILEFLFWNNEDLLELATNKALASKLNSIQDNIIKTYLSSYSTLINYFIDYYGKIYPDVINEFCDETGLNSNNIKEYNWQKFARLLAEDKIKIITKKGQSPIFQYKDETFENINLLSNKIEADLQIKQNSLRPYISSTFNKATSKDIFEEKKLKILKEILQKITSSQSTVSEYYLQRLEELQNSLI